MKAFVAQLIHFYRNDRGMLDGLTLLTETRISGQPRASDEDAEIVLKFLLNRFPCYVILDAIDECAEPLSLLSRISLMCENLDTKILMLSRPDISLPWKYVVAKDKFKVVKLSESCNVPDIELFLEDELGKAIQLGLFGSPEERYHRTFSMLETDSRRRAEEFPHYSAESSTLTWRERPKYGGRLEEQPARHTVTPVGTTKPKMLGVGLGRNIHLNALPIWTHMGPYGYPLRARDVGLGPHTYSRFIVCSV